MNAFSSLKNIVLLLIVTFIAATASYASETTIARGGDRGREGHYNNQDRNLYRDGLNRNGVYDNGAYGSGAYGGGTYGGTVIYPQNLYPPSNAETFPNDAEFEDTYKRNQHAPR